MSTPQYDIAYIIRRLVEKNSRLVIQACRGRGQKEKAAPKQPLSHAHPLKGACNDV